MNNCKKCNNSKANQNRNPQKSKQPPNMDMLPIPKPCKVEIQVPTKEDYVRIPISEYADLVAVSATLDAVARWVESDHGSYIDFGILRALLGLPKGDAK